MTVIPKAQTTDGKFETLQKKVDVNVSYFGGYAFIGPNGQEETRNTVGGGISFTTLAAPTWRFGFQADYRQVKVYPAAALNAVDQNVPETTWTVDLTASYVFKLAPNFFLDLGALAGYQVVKQDMSIIRQQADRRLAYLNDGQYDSIVLGPIGGLTYMVAPNFSIGLWGKGEWNTNAYPRVPGSNSVSAQPGPTFVPPNAAEHIVRWGLMPSASIWF